MSDGNGRSPTWRVVAAVLGIIVSSAAGVIVAIVTTSLRQHDARLDAQADRISGQATKIELQNYRIAADSTLVLENRMQLQRIEDKVDRLLRSRGLAP